jgi:hypothetical protein
MLKQLFKIFLILSISIKVQAQITTFPYYEPFDSGAGGWTTQTISGSSWELGTPTAAGSQGSFTSPNCWGTDLDSGYRVNSLTYLKSPKFYIGSMTNPYFSFMQFRYMPTGMDGLFLQYSTDDISWQSMGYYNCPFASNWYNATSVYSTGNPAFTGISNGWMQSGIYLNGLGQNDSIRIRFVFNSNLLFGSAQPGAFIDNVQISESVIFQKDLYVLSFINPSGNILPGATNSIDILVRNASTVAIDTFTCGIKVGPTYPTTQIIQHIDAGAFDTVHIGTIAFPPGQNTLCAFGSLQGDINQANDTICSTFITSANLPYFEDFETSNGGWYNSTLSTTNWEYGTPNYQTTSGAHSGIKCWDITLDTAYAKYALSYLYTPYFDFTTIGASYLSFWLNYSSEIYYDGTRMEYSTDGGNSWYLLGTVNDPNATNWYNTISLNSTGLPAWHNTSFGWQKSTYNLTFLQSFNHVQFRWVFASDGVIEDDGISIDDVSIQQLPNIEPALLTLSTSYLSHPIGTTTDSILFVVRNQGSQTLTNFNYGYLVNGIQGPIGTFNGTVLPGDTAFVTLPGLLVANTSNLVCGYIQKNADADTTNNQSCLIINGIISYAIPYYESFDTGNLGWYADNSLSVGSEWQLGYPSFGVTTGTHSGNNAWDVNLSTAYNSNAKCYLYTPLFDISTAVHPKLSFWQNRNSEADWDGMRVEFSFDNQNWGVLGTVGYPGTINWYNNISLNSSSLPAWDGTSLGWAYSEFPLDAFQSSPYIQFRFVFTSDNSVVTDGITIDDFAVTRALEKDAYLMSITNPTASSIEGFISPVNVIVKNNGSTPITQLNLSYVFNNGAPQTLNWSGNLQPDSVISLTLGSVTLLGGNNNLIVYNTWLQDMYHMNDTLSATIYAQYLTDAAVTTIINPTLNVASGTTQQVTVLLRNDGVNTLTTIPVTMQLNNATPISSIWSGALSPGAYTMFSMPNITSVIDTNRLKVYIDWANDTNHENDTAYSKYYGYLTASLPYSTDFESANGGWRPENISQFTKWQYGSPSFGATTSTHSGSNCWDINLTTPYFSGANATLISPYFQVNSGNTFKLDFWTNYSTESNADGMFVEYSEDEVNWTHLGIVNDPQGSNWYNSNIMLNEAAWSGFSQGWKQCSYTFNPTITNGYLLLRFKFISDVNVVEAGVSVDDVNLSVMTGINEEIGKSRITVFPNPATNLINIKGNITHPFEIKNALGKSILKITDINKEYYIDFSKYSPGIYFIFGEDFTEKVKIIKL